MLAKAKYKALTGREQKREADVICYQIRQSFLPGEVTPEQANKIGYELGMRWTKGKHAFLVCTHEDKAHVHTHVYYSPVALDCSRKFRNFRRSSFALRRVSDRLCLEHGLSIVRDPKPRSKGKFKHYGEWEAGRSKPPTFQERLRLAIDAALAQDPADFPAFLSLVEAAGFEVKQGRGGAVSFRAPAHGQERFTRLRASTLGDGYGPEDIRAAIAGAPRKTGARPPARPDAPPQRVNLLIDVQRKLQEKGPGYARWAKVYNLKQMAAALAFLQDSGITDYGELAERAEQAAARFHDLADRIKAVEGRLHDNAELKRATVEYARTRPVFDAYKAARYSRKFLAEHEAEIAAYRAARASMNAILAGAKLPKMDKLKEDGRKLLAEKKELYADYRAARQEMREALAVKANIDYLLGITDPGREKAQER